MCFNILWIMIIYIFYLYLCMLYYISFVFVSIILKINIFIIEFFLILNELLSFGCLWMFLVCIDRNIDICLRWYLVS